MKTINIPEKLIGISKKNEPMKKYTSFKVGGSADLFMEPSDVEQLIETIRFLNKSDIPYYVMGNGSNTIIRDGGFRGAVVLIGSQISEIEFQESEDHIVLKAQSGVLLSTLAKAAGQKCGTGMEPLSGIPGSLGGAVFMNAGAYGREIKDVITEAIVYDPREDITKTVGVADMDLSYRHSIFQDHGEVILGASFSLEKGNRDSITNDMKEYNRKRNEKQPVNYPSAGSFFKRPEGHYAGGLIEDAGLKGLKKGGATVSRLHAGFIVNEDNASAKDIEDLMRIVQVTVFDKSKVMLEPEVKIIGEELDI